MVLMFLDSDDSENSEIETAGIGITSDEGRLLLEAPTSSEQNLKQNNSDEEIPPKSK